MNTKELFKLSKKESISYYLEELIRNGCTIMLYKNGVRYSEKLLFDSLLDLTIYEDRSIEIVYERKIKEDHRLKKDIKYTKGPTMDSIVTYTRVITDWDEIRIFDKYDVILDNSYMIVMGIPPKYLSIRIKDGELKGPIMVA